MTQKRGSFCLPGQGGKAERPPEESKERRWIPDVKLKSRDPPLEKKTGVSGKGKGSTENR